MTLKKKKGGGGGAREFIIPRVVNDERKAVEPIAAQPVVPMKFLLDILLLCFIEVTFG